MKVLIILIILIIILFITTQNNIEMFAEYKAFNPILNNINGFWYFPNELIGPNNLPLNYFEVLKISYIIPNKMLITGNLQSKTVDIIDITLTTIDTSEFLLSYKYPILQMTDKQTNKTVILNKIKGTDISNPQFNKRLLGFNGTWFSKQKFEKGQPLPSVTFNVINSKILESGKNNYTLFTAITNQIILLDTPDLEHQLNYYLVDSNMIVISMNNAWVDILKK